MLRNSLFSRRTLTMSSSALILLLAALSGSAAQIIPVSLPYRPPTIYLMGDPSSTIQIEMVLPAA